jgi:peptidyl-prolyl cis-trans isomerase A (cyclophilin A)
MKAPWIGAAALALPALVACGGSSGGNTGGATTTSTSTGGGAGSGGAATGGAATGGTGGAVCGPDTSAPDETLTATSDPAKGVFTMDDALAGLPDGPGPLRAIIDTDLGTLTCELRPDKAPNGVANFVGLARGLRPWKDPKTGKWVKRRFYDGLTFHRVIADFVAQGGDPLGTGYGGPGYKFADEISDLMHHPGTLAYANAGPDTNGSQFYIAEVDLPNLDGAYTIFGACTPVTVVTALTHVPTDSNDKPVTPLHMKTVTITRCAP